LRGRWPKLATLLAAIWARRSSCWPLRARRSSDTPRPCKVRLSMLRRHGRVKRTVLRPPWLPGAPPPPTARSPAADATAGVGASPGCSPTRAALHWAPEASGGRLVAAHAAVRTAVRTAGRPRARAHGKVKEGHPRQINAPCGELHHLMPRPWPRECFTWHGPAASRGPPSPAPTQFSWVGGSSGTSRAAAPDLRGCAPPWQAAGRAGRGVRHACPSAEWECKGSKAAGRPCQSGVLHRLVQAYSTLSTVRRVWY
jgi:hypothetical protein